MRGPAQGAALTTRPSRLPLAFGCLCLPAPRLWAWPRDLVTSDLSPHSGKPLPLHSNRPQRHSPFSFSLLAPRTPHTAFQCTRLFPTRDAVVTRVLLLAVRSQGR